LAAQENKSPLLPGLVATATDGERKVVFVAPTPNFNLTASQSVHPQLKPRFKAGWNGFLTVVRGGKYTINCGAHVFVDGKEIQGRSVQLTPDEHPVRIEFEHKTVAPVRLQLLWQSEFFKQEPIPASAFGHRGEPAEVAQRARIARGRELVEELNYVGCHKIDSTLFTARHGVASAFSRRAATPLGLLCFRAAFPG
jgi:hypothetical protein